MSESVYQKYYKPLPGWAQGVIAVGVLAIAAAVGFTLYKNAKKKKELKEANKAAEQALEELEGLQQRGVHPTMGDSQFEVYAQKLVEAMNGCGTDEDMVLSVFKNMKNDADIRKLIAAFGVRYYRPCAADQPISYTRFLFDSKAFGGPLPTWLAYDLSSGYIEKINSILSKNGINYSF